MGAWKAALEAKQKATEHEHVITPSQPLRRSTPMSRGPRSQMVTEQAEAELSTLHAVDKDEQEETGPCPSVAQMPHMIIGRKMRVLALHGSCWNSSYMRCV